MRKAQYRLLGTLQGPGFRVWGLGASVLRARLGSPAVFAAPGRWIGGVALLSWLQIEIQLPKTRACKISAASMGANQDNFSNPDDACWLTSWFFYLENQATIIITT